MYFPLRITVTLSAIAKISSMRWLIKMTDTFRSLSPARRLKNDSTWDLSSDDVLRQRNHFRIKKESFEYFDNLLFIDRQMPDEHQDQITRQPLNLGDQCLNPSPSFCSVDNSIFLGSLPIKIFSVTP